MGRYANYEPTYVDLIGPVLLELAQAEIDTHTADTGRRPVTIRMTEKERYAAMGAAFRGHLGYEQDGHGFSLVWGVPVVIDEASSLWARNPQR